MIAKTIRKVQLKPTTGLTLNAVVSMLGIETFDGARVLDLYAGTGAFGARALQYGAQRVDWVEISHKHCALIQKRINKQNDTSAAMRIWRGDAIRTIARLPKPYDIIFADPPYDMNCLDALAEVFNAESALTNGGTFIFEHHHARLTPATLQGGLVRNKLKQYSEAAISTYNFRCGNEKQNV